MSSNSNDQGLIPQLLYLFRGPKGPNTRTADLDDPRNQWRWCPEVWTEKDNDKLIAKSVALTRHTAFAAGMASMFHIVLVPDIKKTENGMFLALKRIKFWAFPLIGGGLAYTSTVHMLSNLRGGKSDQINHFWGGMAAGAVIGKNTHSVITGALTGIFLGVCGFFMKDNAMYNNMPYYRTEKRKGGVEHHLDDHTIFPKAPGYWVRCEKDVPAMTQRGRIGLKLWE